MSLHCPSNSPQFKSSLLILSPINSTVWPFLVPPLCLPHLPTLPAQSTNKIYCEMSHISLDDWTFRCQLVTMFDWFRRFILVGENTSLGIGFVIPWTHPISVCSLCGFRSRCELSDSWICLHACCFCPFLCSIRLDYYPSRIIHQNKRYLL